MVKNRRELSSLLERTMRRTYEQLTEKQELEREENLVKSYVLESNRETLSSFPKQRGMDVTLGQSEDDTLKVLKVVAKNGEKALFYLDSLDPRFWILHTSGRSEFTDGYVRGLVASPGNWLDSLWIPGSTLEMFAGKSNLRSFSLRYRNEVRKGTFENIPVKELSMRLWGSHAPSVLSALRQSEELQRSIALSNVGVRVQLDEEEFVLDDIHSWGKFTTRGTSFDAHYRILHQVLDGYKTALGQIEKNALAFDATEDGGKFSGNPLVLRFARPIDDLEDLLQTMLNSESPFRLWGLYQFISDGYAKAWAVDLHTGHKLGLEVATSHIRVYLPLGSCGNAVMRLYTNLQHFYDSSATLEVPQDGGNL